MLSAVELLREARIVPFLQIAGVAELADALDSKSSGREAVWVRAPPPAVLGFDVGRSELSVRHCALDL
jgi:hypothetical protein